ncbi:cytochrome P450 [Streptomyces sp. SID161]|uniref:cytochrome P450 n=1 Tax=Streptomyces sp. SID161 TaxID=2690251 RepID=UPI0031FF0359
MTTASDTRTDHPPLPGFPFSWDGTRVPAEVGALRSTTPVRRVRTIAGDEAWLVSSYELCAQVLKDDRFSLKDTSAPGVPRQYALTIPPEVVNNMGNITGAGLRRAVMKALNPKAPGLMEWLRAEAHRLVDLIVADGPTADLRGAFCEPYSAGMHCRILGIPQSEAPAFLRSLDIAFMNAPCPVTGARLNWDRDIARMAALLDDPATHGLMGELAALRDDPGHAHLDDEMLATVGVTLFGAGVVSTSGFLVMALVYLLTHPIARDLLRDRPELTGQGVEELLRVNLSIGDALPRLALEDVRLGDVDVRAGELVLVLVEGANLDPEKFPDPHRFDIHRDNTADHLSFGGGAHYCPATALGRAHARIALEVLLDRLPELALAVPPGQLVWRTGFMKRIPERLPVTW